MMRLLERAATSLAVGLMGCMIGCGGASKPLTPEDPMQGIVLSEVGEAYRFHSITKGKPPEKLADISKMEGLSPAGIEALKKGEVLVNWGARLPDLGEEAGQVAASEILAYQKQVPDQGGYVLKLDRTIKKMTADEFKAAPKAGKN